ncbi:MAG: hypothetical protein ACREBV_07880 [Candidatus Zixiibacteriota bacterium]
MKEKIASIQTKVDELLTRFGKLNQSNQSLATQNHELKTELNRLRKQLKDSQLGSGDTNEAVKRKLTSVLDRLEELEAQFN